MCPVCVCELGTGQMVRMDWANRTGVLVDCPNCVAYVRSQQVLEAL